MPLNETPAASRPRVTVLDDSRTVLASVRHALEQVGAEVDTATDASELDPGKVRRACLIVVDVNMEQVFGDDVVAFLRDRWQVSAPIYLYSSLPHDELSRRARAAGATGAVCKADGVDALVAQVQKVLGGA
jgi:DNA-binding response OmpR family regulator